jgi:hypothetical protein
MTGELSKIRLHAMRAVYLLTGVGLGIEVWPTLIFRTKPWDPLHGVAFSFWAAYSLLMLFGVRFPVRMLPLLLLQLFYKLTWLIAVAYPLWSAEALSPGALAMIKGFGIAVLMDLIVIPWPYVFERYVKEIFRPSAQRAPLSPQALAR